MSYYGIKNIKTIKTETGYNIACEYYDSSIRDWDMHRVWHKSDKFYNKDFETKAELEYDLFKNFLNGNFHTSGNCGKYQPLSWTNRQIKLPDDELKEVQALEKEYYNSFGNKELTVEEKETIDNEYHNAYYTCYYRAWQHYLKEQNLNKNNKFIIKLNAQGYEDIYVKGLGTRRCKYTYYKEQAKVFRGSIRVILDKLNAFSSQSNIRVIDAVTGNNILY